MSSKNNNTTIKTANTKATTNNIKSSVPTERKVDDFDYGDDQSSSSTNLVENLHHKKNATLLDSGKKQIPIGETPAVITSPSSSSLSLSSNVSQQKDQLTKKDNTNKTTTISSNDKKTRRITAKNAYVLGFVLTAR